MASRSIPPLTSNSTVVDPPKLLHVTAILRHGARTPWGVTNCWDDYWSNPATGVWDCNLTSFVAPPTEGSTLLFDKRYDALSHPPRYSNTLNGTCKVGQLIEQGYQQEFQNGQFLRQAYVGNLLVLENQKMDSILPQIYYRADDDERTLLSGQIVWQSLLGNELHQDFLSQPIPLHTADRERDVVDPNVQACPRLDEIHNKINTSEYTAFNTSQESILMRKFIDEVLKRHDHTKNMNVLDCFMTTICTDRPLPPAIDDYEKGIDVDGGANGEYGANLFQRLVEYNIQQYTLPMKANDAEYARLGMGPLWAEILPKFQAHINPDQENPAYKIALYAGHDDTIMPLLASIHPDLWPDKEWPPYASMVVLELYQTNQDAFGFRLIYNGQVLTPNIPNCQQAQVCDMQVLLDRVQPFAHYEQGEACAKKHPNNNKNNKNKDDGLSLQLHPVEQTQDILSTPQGTLYLVLIVLASALLGAIVACGVCCMCAGGSLEACWRCRRRQTSQPLATSPRLTEEDDEML